MMLRRDKRHAGKVDASHASCEPDAQEPFFRRANGTQRDPSAYDPRFRRWGAVT